MELESNADPEEVDLDRLATDYERLPILKHFTRIWTARYRMEMHLEEPLPSSIQLIIGVMTVAQDDQYRQVVRQTWLRQAGVCYWSLEPQAGCSVYAAFVIGKTGMGERLGKNMPNISEEVVDRSHREPGMLVLDTIENMDKGKSLLWFSTALEMFPWATHIAKMDMDTYPFLHKLLYWMALYRNCASQDGIYEYMGSDVHSRTPRLNFLNACSSSECVARTSSTVLASEGFGYMSGGFYILSRPLVEKMNWTAGKRSGPEDLLVGKKVDVTASQKHFCVAIRHPDAWYHKSSEYQSEYANNFTR